MNSEIIDAKEKSASNDEQKISHRRNAITSESTDLNALSSSLFYTALHSELIDLAGQSKEIETNKAYIRSSLQFPSKSPIPGSLEVSDGKKDSDEHYHNSQRSSHHHKSHHHGHHHKHRTPKRSRKEIVVNVKEMIAKAKETVPKPMPGGLGLCTVDSKKYFGAEAKQHFFDQCNSLTKNRNILYLDPTLPLSGELAHSLHMVHSLRPTSDVNGSTGDVNAGLPFSPVRQARDETTSECTVDTRILIREQGLSLEEGFKQMKVITKPSYIHLSEGESDSDRDDHPNSRGKTPNTSSSLPALPSPIKTANASKTSSATLNPHSSPKKMSVQHSVVPKVKAKPMKKLPPKGGFRRLPPLNTDLAESVVASINDMFDRVVNKTIDLHSVLHAQLDPPSLPMPPANFPVQIDSSAEHKVLETARSHVTEDSYDPSSPPSICPPDELTNFSSSNSVNMSSSTLNTSFAGSSRNLNASLKGLVRGSSAKGGVIRQSGSNFASKALLTANLSAANLNTSASASVLNKKKARASSPRKGRGGFSILNDDAKSEGKADAGLHELASLYKEHTAGAAEEKREKRRKKEDVHSIRGTEGGLEFICIEHRDENNKDLISPALNNGNKKGKGALFKYVQSKLVKDFYETSHEYRAKDSYVYSEVDTDLEIAMWQWESEVSPAKVKGGGAKKDGEEDVKKDEKAGERFVLSPRSQYIDNCIRQRLNPRAGLLLRKQLTRELSLKHLGMGDEMAILLSEALINTPYIESMDITDNNLTDKGLSSIVNCIVSIPSITYLNMSCNVIGSDAAAALATYLSSPTCSLQSLILQKADVDDDECRNFVDALHQNRSLLTLDLSDNKVGSSENLNTVMPDLVTGGEALAELLRSEYCTLQTLKLGWNLIRLGGADDLCNSLSMNKSITYLDLSFNSLGSTGGIALGDALQDNVTLRTLHVSNNSLDSIACVTICAGILQNKNLEYVNFDGNPIAQQGAKALMLLPTIVGSRVTVSARNCNISLIDSKNWFDSGMITRPYDLDLSDPFHRAIAIILTYLVPSHQTYIVARSEYIDTEQPKGEWINLNLQETVVEDARKLEPEQMKEIEGINRIRDATRDIRKAMALFNEVDKDGSGELDEEEFEYLMQVLGMDLSEGKVKEVMAEYDVDGGGIIEMHEFLLFLRNQQKEAGKRLKELTEYPILISGLQYNLPPPAIHVVNVPQDYTPSQTNNASMAHMSSGHSMISAAGSVGSNESFKGGQSSSIIVHSVVNMQHGTSKSIDKINKPHFIKYNPPRHGLLKLNVVDGFTQKESYRVISPGDRGNIMEIAKQSGDVLQMTSFGVQNYKIRLNEALGFVQTMSKENANKISILKTILPHMSSATDARQVVSKVLCNNKIDINRLKREIGQAYRVIMGQPDGFYTLDLSHEMDRFCLNRLLELSMTRAHLRSVKFGTLGYGKLGDTSQKGNWSCFRNELLNKKPIVITIQFASPLPKAGRVEFDFVSLNRATSDSFVLNDLRFTNLLVKSYLLRISDRYKALSILKKTKHQCEKCIYGDGKTMYETPKDRALEIGLHMSAFYEHLPDRFDEYERYRAREGVKVSWEYDPEIIQLTLSNMGEIYTIPSIFTLSEAEANAKKNSQAATRLGSTDGVGTAAAAAAAARGVGGKKLLNVAKKVKMVSNLSTEGKADGIKKGSLVDVLAVPSKPSSPQVIEPVIDTLASGSYSARTSSSDSVLSSSRAPSAFPSARGGSGSGQPSARKNTDLGSGVVTTTIDNTENFKLESDEDTNELLSSGSDTDNDTEVAQYLVDSPDYKPKWDGVDWGGGMFPTTPHGGGGSAGGFNSGDKSGDRGGGAGLSGGTGGSGGGVGSKSRPSLLNNMMGGKGKVGEITRKNTMANLPPAALTGPQYHPSLLRENTLVLGNDLRPYNSRGGEMGGIGGNLNKEMSTKGLGAGDGVLKTTAGAMAQSFYIKSLPPDKKPLNETYNRYLCLLASRNVQGPAKAAKTLEILLDIFEYCYLYARHLEVLVLLFEEYGRYKHADHFGTYRVELVVQLFSNVVDVYNFEIVLRRLTAYEVACVIGRIGLLNLFNPMKPEGSYELDLSRREERLVVKMLAQLSVVEPGDNLPFIAFQWERTMDYMPGYELTELWMTEDGMPNKGIWAGTYYAGEGSNKKGCKPMIKFRKALLQLVLVDEEDMLPEKTKEGDILPPLVGTSAIHANPAIWVGYLVYNEQDWKEFKNRKGAGGGGDAAAKGKKK